jgi:hypothetical protein
VPRDALRQGNGQASQPVEKLRTEKIESARAFLPGMQRDHPCPAVGPGPAAGVLLPALPPRLLSRPRAGRGRARAGRGGRAQTIRRRSALLRRQGSPPARPGAAAVTPARLCIRYGKGCSDGGRSVPGSSRCARHTRSNWNKYRPAHRAVYRKSRWTDLRARVLREEPICAEEGCQERSTSVDHIQALSEGGEPYDRANCRGMCRKHHRERSSRQGAEARKPKRAQP